MVSNMTFFVLHQFLQLEIFEGGDFKYGNNSSKLYPPKHPHKAFFVPNFMHFVKFGV